MSMISSFPIPIYKSVYQYAVDAGYTGTENEFGELLADSASKTYVNAAIQEAISGAIEAVYYGTTSVRPTAV